MGDHHSQRTETGHAASQGSDHKENSKIEREGRKESLES